MFRIPYRWLPRTIWPNLCSMGSDIRHGLSNLWRWLPIVWFDHDYDWADLAKIMEIKFRRLATCMKNGYHDDGPRLARHARVCAALLHRLQADQYFQNAGYDPKTWKTLSPTLQRQIAQHTHQMEVQDQRYLGLLIGKHLRRMWE